MGNEQTKQNLKMGFYTPNTSPLPPPNKPNTSNANNGSTSNNASNISDLQNSTSTLDQLLQEIANEINQDYTNNNKKNLPDNNINNSTTSIHQSLYKKLSTHASLNLNMSFVPKKNYIHKIHDIFKYKKQLGYGSSGRVLLVVNKKTKKQYALKEMNKNNKFNQLAFINEYNLLKQIKHKNIIKYIDSWIDANCYYLATNYCSGGTMLDKITTQGQFSERACADFMKDVLMAIKYLHSINIVHRDLKCANLVFDKKGKNGILKIIDFGSSELIKDKNKIDELFIGSWHYISPEMASGMQRTKGQLFKDDMWAIGVVCYILVTGQLPFFGKDKTKTLKNIKKGKFKWPKNVNLSDSCKFFVSSLLKKDINLRYNAQEALNDEWIISKATNDLFDDVYLSQIQTFHQANKLQKILINSVLSEMEKNDKKILLKAIRDLDIDGNKTINENDIINYILLNGSVIPKDKSAKNRPKTLMAELRNELPTMSSNDLRKLPVHQLNHVQAIADDILLDGIVDDILQELTLIDDDASTDDDDDNKNDNNNIDNIQTAAPSISNIKTNIANVSNTDKPVVFDVIEDNVSDDDAGVVYITNDDDVVNAQKLDLYNFSTPSPFTPIDDNSDDVDKNLSSAYKISVQRFSSLLSKAQKVYNVPNLVLQLDPTPSDNILLSNINNFNLPLHSVNSNSPINDPFKKATLNLSNASSTSQQDDDHVIKEQI